MSVYDAEKARLEEIVEVLEEAREGGRIVRLRPHPRRTRGVASRSGPGSRRGPDGKSQGPAGFILQRFPTPPGAARGRHIDASRSSRSGLSHRQGRDTRRYSGRAPAGRERRSLHGSGPQETVSRTCRFRRIEIAGCRQPSRVRVRASPSRFPCRSSTAARRKWRAPKSRAAQPKLAPRRLTAEVQLRLRGAWEETQARLRAVETYQKRAVAQTEDLVRIARSAYEGGEVGILELLDAFRTQREVRLRMQDLIAAARQSALELERLAGEEVIR